MGSDGTVNTVRIRVHPIHDRTTTRGLTMYSVLRFIGLLVLMITKPIRGLKLLDKIETDEP